MIRATYVSNAVKTMTEGDLEALLQECRRYNSAHGITGMLVYSNDVFLQVLEGEREAVDELLDRIHRDERHTSIKMLERRPIEEREYGDWSMGFQKVTDEQLRRIPELREFSAENFNVEYISRNNSVVRTIMEYFRKQRLKSIGQDDLSLDEPDRLIHSLNVVIRFAVRIVAVLMVFTILWGVIDVVYVLYTKLIVPAMTDFEARDIIVTFGAFLTVLIAIEIFMNITLYLRDDVIHIRLVISTALMAIARKVIILDFELVTPMQMFATAAVVVALGITYWLVGDRTLFGKIRSF